VTRHTASTIDDEALDALYATLDAVSNRIQHTMIDAAEIHRQISQTLEPTPAAPSLRLVTDADATTDAEVEQLREQLAAAEERAEKAEATLRVISNARRWSDVFAHLGMHFGWTSTYAGQQARERRLDAEHERDRARNRATGWRQHALDADARAARYRTAWQSARRRAHLATGLEQALADARVTAKRWADEADRQQQRAAELGNRLRLAHQARRAKEHQLDDIRRALCDAGIMRDDDPYSHADLADVIRQAAPAATEATDVPEPCRRHPMCPCARCTTPAPEVITDRANPDCEHTLNWHVGPGGVCVARGAVCPCNRFQPPPTEDRP
jgi:hypothetical protein